MEIYYEYGLEGMELLLSLVFSLIPSLLLGIAAYVLRAIGVYTIAKRRNIKRPWFAWVPVVDAFLLGCVSDQYRYVVRGQNKNKRTWLLWLNIGQTVLVAGMLGTAVSVFANAVVMAMNGASEEMMARTMMPAIMGLMGVSMPMMILSIVTLVIRSMALYDL